jgi:hypothetical protein
LSEDLAVLGLPAEIMPETEVKNFEVFEENWATVEIFCRLATQWNWGAVGGCLGLNYQSVEFVMNLYKPDEPKSVFKDLQIMESAALEIFNEKKA